MSTAAMTTKIEFEPTRVGINEAREKLDRFAKLLGDDGPDAAGKAAKPTPPASGSPSDEAPRAVYRSSTEGSRTRELLKVLPDNKADALTPTEIGKLLTPNYDDGSALHSGQVRAVMRNEKKIEQTLKKRGVIADDREVVIGDFTRYEDEGCGRYYVSADDRKVLQSL